MGSEPRLSTQWVLVKASVASVELGSLVGARGPSCRAPQRPGMGPVPSDPLELVLTGSPLCRWPPHLASPAQPPGSLSPSYLPPNSSSLLGPLLRTYGLWATCLEAPLLC